MSCEAPLTLGTLEAQLSGESSTAGVQVFTVSFVLRMAALPGGLELDRSPPVRAGVLQGLCVRHTLPWVSNSNFQPKRYRSLRNPR